MEEICTTVGGRTVIISGIFERPPDLAMYLAAAITNGDALEWCRSIGAIEGEEPV